ncbi:uncharacterized protein LOC122066501 isoform X3 [Macadamia integrifolia]|uniref:uncharacterized protein LOC122066501 isoform X3 n=1 Tax=Macadamia integrifolia TaxID=60698 RepID=UPI001C4F8027|nr:uncharacterized protein LOC122066501 isoform X3 [Macadamia integrifolia]
MLPRWCRTITQLSKVGLQKNIVSPKELYAGYRNYSKVAAAATATVADSPVNGVSTKPEVNLLLTRWMKDLEKIFYGNVVAYNAAMLPEARQDEQENAIWRNVFSDDGSPMSNDAASSTVQATSRYVLQESYCLSLTDKEAIFSGNFIFSSLQNPLPDAMR